MLNKLTAFIRRQGMIAPGDEIVCAVSGGADSVALLFGLYLLKEKMKFSLSAAHFNHGLRGEESNRDEQFVRQLCDRYDIPLFVGGGRVTAGKKGLEAAARDARYAFFATLPGKIATAHTANDNAETVLMHLVRGTGLKGLGGIVPVTDKLIRPMLGITRQEVLAFLEEYCLSHVEDGSNGSDEFLRNRLRHHVMPLLEEENPRLALNLSAMALRLRQEESFLAAEADKAKTLEVDALRQLPEALRSRVLEQFLTESGVREPEAKHMGMVESLVFSDKPSAAADLPGGITVERCYQTLRVRTADTLEQVEIPCPGEVQLPRLGLRLICRPATEMINTKTVFTVVPQGTLWLRSRVSGDEMRLPGGSKSLKKLFIDRKIPASQRPEIPVLADDGGVLGVYGIGANLDRIPMQLPAVQLAFEKE